MIAPREEPVVRVGENGIGRQTGRMDGKRVFRWGFYFGAPGGG